MFAVRGRSVARQKRDAAAAIVRRRALLGASQPLSDIAYACGFRDYTHFARKFRQRFG